MNYWGAFFHPIITYGHAPEVAAGTDDGVFSLPGIRNAGYFPIYFTPRGVPAEFGDAGWAAAASPFLHLLARRFDEPLFLLYADAHGGTPIDEYNYYRHSDWYTLLWRSPEYEYLDAPQPTEIGDLPPPPSLAAHLHLDTLKVYEEIRWAAVASSWPVPELYVSFKSGYAMRGFGHTCVDLNAIQIVAGGELLITRSHDYGTPGEGYSTLMIDGKTQRPATGTFIYRDETNRHKVIAAEADRSFDAPVSKVRRHLVMVEDAMATPIISGSFFDLQHVNLWDAAHWTDRCRYWKEDNWRALMADMHGLGIDTAICTSCALWGRPMFRGYEQKVGLPLLMGSEDPLTACVDEADRLGMGMFLGIGLRGRVSQVRDYSRMEPPWPQDWFRWNAAMAEALVDKYGGRTSFRGLYLTYEMDFEEHQVELYEQLMAQWLRPAVGQVQVLASPGSLGDHPDLGLLPRQLERMGIDILACQDYGGRDNEVDKALELARQNLAGLGRARRIVDEVGVALWTNCEVFSRRWGPDGRPICTPGPIERIVEQLRLQAPVADKVICYQYQGIMNRRTELVDIGAPGTQGLYDEYRAYLDTVDEDASDRGQGEKVGRNSSKGEIRGDR